MSGFIVSPERCCGCGACEGTCPKDAIIKVEGPRKNVYFYKGDNCIECGACKAVCPVYSPSFHAKRQVFLKAASGEVDARYSSSGGIAHELAKLFISNGGVVYGAAWNSEAQRVEHVRCDNSASLMRLQGSKYVQSVIERDLIERISADVHRRQVLFVGTPCQVMSVRNRLKDTDGLTCVDLVCHGVPSPELLDEQLRILTKGKKIEEISFRDKLTFRLQLKGDGFCISKEWLDVPYYALYMHFADLREGCYSCQFAREERVGDITLGDYVENGHGYSCILVNSEKGNAMVEQLSDRIGVEPKPLVNLSENIALHRPTPKHRATERFTRLYKRFGLRPAYYFCFPLFVTKRVAHRLLGDRVYGQIKRYLSSVEHA